MLVTRLVHTSEPRSLRIRSFECAPDAGGPSRHRFAKCKHHPAEGSSQNEPHHDSHRNAEQDCRMVSGRIPDGRTTVWPRRVSRAVPCGGSRSFGGPQHVVLRVIAAADDRCARSPTPTRCAGGSRSPRAPSHRPPRQRTPTTPLDKIHDAPDSSLVIHR